MDCEMINSSGNGANRNNSGKNESLFWKVFSNVYLLKYIIKKIHTTEIIYDDYKKISEDNRYKFKDIYSLDWMVEKKQYPLLRNKIENDDYIHFDIETVQFMFEHLSILTGRIKPDETQPPTPKKKETVKSSAELELEKEKKEYEKQQEIESLIGIIKLLLDKKRMDFEICDLTLAAVEYDCLDALKILTSEPYSIIVYPSTLELAISLDHPSIVKELLSLNQSFNLVTDEIRYRSLKLASQNDDHANEMIEFILSNPNLYQMPPISELSPDEADDEIEQPQLKKKRLPEVMFLAKDEELSDKGSDSEEESEPEPPFDYYISFKDFNRIKSIESLEKLMELDIVSKKNLVVGNGVFDITRELKITLSIEEMMVLLKIHFKYCNGGYNNDQIPKVILKKINKIHEKYSQDLEKKKKEFIKLLILKFKSYGLYNQFMLKYQESIDDYQEDGYYVDGCSENERNFLLLFRYIGNSNFKLYFGLDTYKKELIKCMDKVKKKKLEYYPILSLIDIPSNSIKITNQQVLDWLIKCDLTLVNSFLDKCLISIEYSTVELLQYSQLEETNKLSKLSSSNIYEAYIDLVNRSSNLEKCFYDAIQECNIDKLIVFETITISKSLLQHSSKLTLPKDELEILKLVKYFNVSGYISFNFFDAFAKMVFKTIPTIQPSIFQVDFKSICKPACEYNSFINTILTLDFKVLEIYLNNLNHVQFNDDQINTISNTEMNLFDSNKNVFHHFDHDENELLKSAKLFMDKFKNRQFKQIGSYQDKEKQSYQAIFNYFFQTLIQIKGVTLEQVYSLHKLLVDNSFEIRHTLYHSFYYLQIRNPKFIKYILSRPGIEYFFTIQGIDIFSAAITYIEIFNDQDGIIGFNLQKYLDINEFTFDYILGGSFDKYIESFIYFNSFDEILQKLVMQLSINIEPTESSIIIEEFFISTMNADLFYYLDIKRIDLFFYQLKLIQSKLNQTIEPDYEFENSAGFPLQNPTHCSPASQLLPTSTLFANSDKPKKLPLPTDQWKENLLFPCSSFVHSFTFSAEVIDLVVMVLDLESLQKFISFNFYINEFVNTLFVRSIWWSKFDNVKFLMDNYNIEFFCIPIFQADSHYNYQGEFKFLVENYPHKIPDPRILRAKFDLSISKVFPLVFLHKFIRHLASSENQQDYDQFISPDSLETRQEIIEELILTIYNEHVKSIMESNVDVLDIEDNEFIDIDKKLYLESMISNDLQIQSIIKLSLDNFSSFNQLKKEKEIQQQLLEYNDHDNSIFINAFVVGDIKMCNLILNQFPLIFKITKRSIKHVIQLGKIHIIKYFYNQDNCKLLINNFQTDPELLNYLKQKLSIHPDYKFNLNWL